MNIIIPLGGKGERFLKNGYTQPKPLIQIFEKKMIEYVLDNLTYTDNDKLFIIYNHNLDDHDFSKYIKNLYPFITTIKINDTKGAVETLFIGINYIIDNYNYHNKCLILDCDTFYTENIIDIFRKSNDNMVFYTKNYEPNSIYSYIEFDDEYTIKNIKEKTKISDNANTGAYAFTDIKTLHRYCRHVLDNNITFNNEHYTSCVISEMINNNISFKATELDDKCVFSLGTPIAVTDYVSRTYAFLFDLDGTIVITDNIYYNVWNDLLKEYNIVLTKEIFNEYIKGNNDTYILNTLLVNINIDLKKLSQMKDELFIMNISNILIVDGIYDIINQIKLLGHKICIVTNCNKNVANKILEYINIFKNIDFIVSSEDCIHGKPNSEPYIKAIEMYNISNNKCFIFEDSKTGILSGKYASPNLLIGIETSYDKEQMLLYGVDNSIKNYLNININDFIINNNKKIEKNKLIEIVKKYSSIQEIDEVIIDNNKLKGGFIADVISLKILSKSGEIYPQILKYENKENNNLSIMAKQLQLYQREYYFYKYISSKIKNIKIPKFYNLIKNEKNENYGILLENLNEKNFKINLNLNIVSVDVTLKIIDRMANMHSQFWNKDIKNMFPELKKSNDNIFYPFLSNFIIERYDLFKTKWFKILNTFQIEKCEYMFKNFKNIQYRFSIGNNITFIHGDIKSPNIFYDIDKDYEPYFLDWQHCAIGKGVQDLIFFIIESFDIVNIKVIFNLTKNYYYKKIIEYGVSNYTFEEYENDIYQAICYIPFFTSVWFGTIPQDELIDKNFPYFLITKMFYLLELL
jgi:beta-phosphoglucomutase-like phosphatase (HAD superfamily)/GTP:adenosylcobinamide-phosphate guanylyltransferase